MKICSECLHPFESEVKNGNQFVCSEKCKISKRRRIKTEEDRNVLFEVTEIMEKCYDNALIEMGVRR